jgi:AcrR family transcriptional regulator
MVAPNEDSNDARGQLLAAARALFAQRGFDGASLADIAAQVGVSKAAVLHHFASKDVLRRAVLEEILGHFRDTLPRLLLAATASRDRFEAVFGELYRYFAQAPDRARVLLREALDRPDEMRLLLAGPVRPWLAAVADYIRLGQAHGTHYPDLDPEAYCAHMIYLVVTAVSGAPVCQAALGPQKDAPARYTRELARIARASLFPPSPVRPAAKKRRRR